MRHFISYSHDRTRVVKQNSHGLFYVLKNYLGIHSGELLHAFDDAR